MPQIKGKEVQTICCSQLRKLFNGEITQEELNQSLRELENRMMVSEESKAPTLFDDDASSEGR